MILVLLLLLLCMMHVISVAGAGDSCPYETVPSNLNSPAYLALRGEMHIQGTYRTDYANDYHGQFDFIKRKKTNRFTLCAYVLLF